MIKSALWALLLAFAWSGGALAKTCDVTGAAVAFGVYDPTSSASLDTTGTLSMVCDEISDAVLSLGIGNGAGASFLAGRKMSRSGGGGTLIYNLYADAARSQVFGDGTGGSVTLKLSGKKTYNQPIFARIRGNQSGIMSGNYADTVLVTISY
jgi:spore coat protein U-like protein